MRMNALFLLIDATSESLIDIHVHCPKDTCRYTGKGLGCYHSRKPVNLHMKLTYIERGFRHTEFNYGKHILTTVVKSIPSMFMKLCLSGRLKKIVNKWRKSSPMLVEFPTTQHRTTISISWVVQAVLPRCDTSYFNTAVEY